MSIFISHSRKDGELVERVKRSLNVLGEAFTPIVYEDIPPSAKKGPDWDNIDRLVKEVDMLLLFRPTFVFLGVEEWEPLDWGGRVGSAE